MSLEWAEDRRLYDLHARPDCFLCGKPIVNPESGLELESEVDMGVRLKLHRECLEPLTPGDFIRRAIAAHADVLKGLGI